MGRDGGDVSLAFEVPVSGIETFTLLELTMTFPHRLVQYVLGAYSACTGVGTPQSLGDFVLPVYQQINGIPRERPATVLLYSLTDRSNNWLDG